MVSTPVSSKIFNHSAVSSSEINRNVAAPKTILTPLVAMMLIQFGFMP